MSRLDEVVFIVERDRIIKARIRDIDPREFAQCTATLAGTAPTFFRSGAEVWALSTAQAWPVCAFASEDAAAGVLDELLADDFWESDLLAFRTRAEAEECFREIS